MKIHQIVGLVLIGISLFILYKPDSISPVDPETKALAALLASNMGGENTKADARVLSGILRATSNLLVLDTQRATPFYGDTESFKWVIRNVGDITYPDGWVMSQKYPSLPGFLAQHLNGKLGEDFTRENLVMELRKLADGFSNI